MPEVTVFKDLPEEHLPAYLRVMEQMLAAHWADRDGSYLSGVMLDFGRKQVAIHMLRPNGDERPGVPYEANRVVIRPVDTETVAREILRAKGMAKLTPDEKRALGLVEYQG